MADDKTSHSQSCRLETWQRCRCTMIMNVSAKNVKRAIFSILAEITTSQFTYYKLKSLPATV